MDTTAPSQAGPEKSDKLSQPTANPLDPLSLSDKGDGLSSLSVAVSPVADHRSSTEEISSDASDSSTSAASVQFVGNGSGASSQNQNGQSVVVEGNSVGIVATTSSTGKTGGQLVAGKFEVIRVTLPAGPTTASMVTASSSTDTASLSQSAPRQLGPTAVNVTVNVTLQQAPAAEPTSAPVAAVPTVPTVPALPKAKEAPPTQPEGETDDDDDEEDGKEPSRKVVETSSCGRYHKRRERLLQREVPGVDAAFLAMDTEEGKEVVWNEVQFSEKKNFKEKEEQIHQIFDNLINLHHPSILKFHRWWTDIDASSDKPRVIFITEHISSGSLNHFIKTSKHGSSSAASTNAAVSAASASGTTHTLMPEKSWKRWSRQILTALNYLHTAKPPIVHGNLNLDTVFLQHNGLIKIGCVAPDAIHQHVRTSRDHVNVRNLHFVAPEYAFETLMTPASDIYSFGILTLEMLIYGIHGVLTRGKEKEKEREREKELQKSADSTVPSSTSTESTPSAAPQPSVSTTSTAVPTASLYPITPEMVNTALETLEDGPVKHMIRDCLHLIPDMRPSAKNLLFHPAFFEVPPLKQIAAFSFIDYFPEHLDNWNDLAVSFGKEFSGETVIAENPVTKVSFKVSQLQNGDLDKYLEDVRQGVYPLTATGIRRWWGEESPTTSLLTTPAQSTRDEGESMGLGDDFEEDFVSEIETRLIMSCMCTIRTKHDSPVASDKMNRHLVCEFDEENDSADSLAEELLEYGLINEQDQDKLINLIEATMRTTTNRKTEFLADALPTQPLPPPSHLFNGLPLEDSSIWESNLNGLPLAARTTSSTALGAAGTVEWDVVVRSPVTTFNSSPAPAPQNLTLGVNVNVASTGTDQAQTVVVSVVNGVMNGTGPHAPGSI